MRKMVSFGLGKKKKDVFFGLSRVWDKEKILFVCFFFQLDFVLLLCMFVCLFVNFHLFLSTFVCFCSHLFLSFFLCSSYNNKTKTSLQSIKNKLMLLLPGWDASPSHGSAYLGLNQIELSCSYRILLGESVCIVFIHQLVVTEIELHFFIHMESAQFNYLNSGLKSVQSNIFVNPALRKICYTTASLSFIFQRFDWLLYTTFKIYWVVLF